MKWLLIPALILLLGAAVITSCAAPRAASEPPPPAAAKPAEATPSAPAAPQPITIKRVVLCSKKPCGSSVTTLAADGMIRNVYDVHDNGRGPGADETFHLGADGTMTDFKSHGHTYVGTTVDETFSLSNGRAVWSSNAEHGEADVTRPSYFVPVSPGDRDWVLLAALMKNGGTLPLLPAGTTRLKKTGEAVVHLPAGDRHLVLQEVTGLNLLPDYIWTDDDGTFFGEVAPGYALMPEGAESAADQLLPIQEAIDQSRDLALYTRLAKKPPEAGLALLHARVLDVERGVWVPDQTLLIKGDLIAELGNSKSVKVPKGAETIDLAGKALLPGLWDMHAHLGRTDGALNIASGVTTVRDVGNVSTVLDAFKEQFDNGTAIGPRVYRAGFIEGRGPDAAHAEITATTEEEAKAGVEFFYKRGYEMMKIYNSIKPELVPVICKAAHEHGMTVTGHIPTFMLAHEAVEAGYDGIEHVNMLFLNFFADHTTDTRTTRRFSLVGEQAAEFDFKSKPAQDFFALLRAHHTVIDPTLDTFEALYIAEQGEILPGIAHLVSRLPAQMQRDYKSGGLPDIGEKRELYKRSWQKMIQLPKALQDAQVTVVAGTDDLAGLTLHHELELLVEGGLTPAEAIRDATIVPARVMKAEAKSGSIQKGKLADLVIIDGDPLASISDIAKTVATFRGGIEFPAREVYESVGVAPW